MIDLFEHYNELPGPVKKVIDNFDVDKDIYQECGIMAHKLLKLGYQFEYGLDGIPYKLEKISK